MAEDSPKKKSAKEAAAQPGEAKPRLLSGGNPHLDIYEGRLDEARFTDWVKQASQLPGERM